MCFSAGASFGAGVVLSVVGVASIKKAQAPSQIIFASIPLLFAVQQITEGFLWLALTDPAFASLQQVTTYNFLFFAQVAWPVWVPFAILKLEPGEKQRTIEKVLVGIGTLVSIYLGYCLLSYHVEAKIIGYHISYHQDYPASLGRYGGLLYVIATIAPPFFSRIRHMWMLGAAVLISYVITAILYTDYIVSVWCFFASIISIAIYAIMHNLKSSKQTVPNIA
ncbi:MAG TPA: DUF6629 family protein [Cyclobacteriaceae bacterium]|nr:DUF6629 family protein [Cyclobacteriaceae bacterium]